MIKKLRSFPLLQGVRGQQSIDIKAFETILVKLSALLEAAPEIAEMDLNPLLGTSKGVTAVDARIRIEK